MCTVLKSAKIVFASMFDRYALYSNSSVIFDDLVRIDRVMKGCSYNVCCLQDACCYIAVASSGARRSMPMVSEPMIMSQLHVNTKTACQLICHTFSLSVESSDDD